MEKYEVDVNLIKKQKIVDIDIVLKMLCQISVADKKALFAIEEKIYEFIEENGQDNGALVALAMSNIMLGNRYKSKSIAQNIWDKGGDIGIIAYILYVDVLINLGMFEMAHAMLKPKIDNIVDNMDLFSRVITKLSLLSGDFMTLKKVSVLLSNSKKKDDILKYIKLCEEKDSMEEVSKMLDILNVGIGNYVYAYDYKMSKGLKVIVYLGKEISNKKEFEKNIAMDKFPKKAREIISIEFKDYEKYDGTFF